MPRKHSIQDVTEAMFNDLVNLVLIRRDSYQDQLCLGVWPATALRGSLLHLDTLFAEEIVAKAEEQVNGY